MNYKLVHIVWIILSCLGAILAVLFKELSQFFWFLGVLIYAFNNYVSEVIREKGAKSRK